MRFKKLRVFVGIALILFLFIAGNIIIFGKFTHHAAAVQELQPEPTVALVDTKTVTQPPPTTQETSEPVEESPPPNTSEPTVEAQPAPPPPEPIIIHTTRRTRAS